jgi:DHA1 family bicyclomycin/chloramphenicol resistance-like MFS transporter
VSTNADGARPSRAALAVLVAGFALLAFGTDFLIPSLPGIQRHFAVAVGDAQLVLSAFVVAFAFAQLAYGPLSDRFGRRPTLLAGWALFASGSLVCLTAPSLGVLIVGRVIQAIGCCSLTVVGRAAVRDLFGAEGTARMMGVLLSLAAIPIVLAPMTGGLVEQAFGWRANFAVLAVVAAACLVVMWRAFRETNHDRNPHATRPGQLLANYRTLLGNRRFVGYTLCIMFNYAAIMAFLSGASFALVSTGHLGPRAFGFWFGCCIMGYAIASFTAARHVQRLGVARLMGIGSTIAAVAGTLMAALAFSGLPPAPSVLVPYFLFMLGNGLVNPSGTAGAVLPFPRMAGTASSFLGFLQLGSGALVGFLVGRLHDGTTVPMAMTLGLASWGIVLAHRLVVLPAERLPQRHPAAAQS